MFTKHSVLPPKYKTFNLQCFVFNHLFITFLNPNSNSLSKVTPNLSKDESSWPSHCKTLMFKILGIKVLTASSHAFFPTHHLSTSHFYYGTTRFVTSDLPSLTYYIIFFFTTLLVILTIL